MNTEEGAESGQKMEKSIQHPSKNVARLSGSHFEKGLCSWWQNLKQISEDFFL